MDPKTIRTYGAIAISVLASLIFSICLALAFWSKDTAMQQLLIGVAAGQFSAVVGYWIGSSASSAQKDEQLEKRPPPTV
jgi:hypothetical protein